MTDTVAKDGGLDSLVCPFPHSKSDANPKPSLAVEVIRKDARNSSNDESRLEGLIRISQNGFKSTQELFDYALHEAIDITGSELGYIYFYDEGKKEFTLNSWSREVLPACEIVNPQTVYQLDDTGILGEVVRQRKPIMDNDFESEPNLKKGYPADHLRLKKYLSLPIFDEDRIVAVIGVANKKENYDKQDIRQLHLLMDYVWKTSQIKQKQKEITESEEKFKKAFRYSPAMMVTSDIETGEIYDANQTVLKALGYEREEVIGKTTRELGIYADFSDRSRLIQSIKDKGYAKDFEFGIRTKSGEILDGLVSANTLEVSGEVSLLTQITDVTKQNKTRKALESSERELKRLFENMPEGLAYCEMIYDANGKAADFRYVSVNDSFSRITGLEDVVNKRVTEIFPEITKHNPEVFEIYQRVLSTKKPERFELDFKPLGMILDISVYSTSDTHFVTVFENITERKKNEEELKQSVLDYKQAIDNNIVLINNIVEVRDPYTAGHERRVDFLSAAIGKEMGLDEERLRDLSYAAKIHDIGKIGVPSEILSKPGKISKVEFQLLQGHAQAGYDILKDIKFKGPIATIVYQHHERIDGSGYPQKLKGDEILLESRILGVADSVEAMVSHRPYRPGLGLPFALGEISKGRGTIYDEQVVDATLRIFNERIFAFQ